MNIIEIIEKKKFKNELTEQEILFFVKEYIKGEKVKDYQASSLLMAMRLNGLSPNESYYLTKAFVETSEKYNFIKTDTNDILIDKHSSGGVGDKVSLILIPILNALGISVPKISGKGLGHTGGTIDKLASIGVKTDYNMDEANAIFKKTRAIILSQNDNLVPADKKLYALRDVTGTVDCQGLMASSILSKKFVINSDYIFIDLKVGNGALLTTLAEAEQLASIMIEVAKKMQRHITVNITSMEKPLGQAIGNFIEVQETLDFLNGTSQAMDLKEIIYAFCEEILVKTNKAKTLSEATEMIDEVLHSKKATQCFYTWIEAQGGHYEAHLHQPKHTATILVSKDGYLEYLSTHEIGMISLLLGAGRETKEANIDMSAGVYLDIQDNCKVTANQVVATLLSEKPISQDLITRFKQNFKVNLQAKPKTPIVLKTYSC